MALLKIISKIVPSSVREFQVFNTHSSAGRLSFFLWRFTNSICYHKPSKHFTIQYKHEYYYSGINRVEFRGYSFFTHSSHSITLTPSLSLHHSHSITLTPSLSLHHSHSTTLTPSLSLHHSPHHSHSITLTQGNIVLDQFHDPADLYAEIGSINRCAKVKTITELWSH